MPRQAALRLRYGDELTAALDDPLFFSAEFRRLMAYGIVWWAFKSGSFADLLQILSNPIVNLEKQLRVALPLVVFAGALWVFQKPLARLIAPRAGKVCAECGYDLRQLKAAHCPECGAPAPKPATPSA